MAIRKQPLRGLSGELSLYGEQAGLSVLRAVCVAAIDLPRDPDVEDLEALRDIAARAISEVVMAYGPTVATAALSAWDEVTGDKSSASSSAVAERALADVRDLADRKARWAIGEVMGGRADPAWFARKCSEAAWKGVNEVHLSALDQAAARIPDVRWARVPSGSDTCPFCLMLASRGFVYTSAKAAGGHYHPHCDCRVVAGNDGKTHVEDYKWEEMEARVDSCASALGLSDAFDPDGNPIPEVLEEVARRDPVWVLTGKPARVAEMPGAKPHKHEQDAAGVLAALGLPVTFRPEDKTFSTRQADMFIGGEKWEMKNPEGGNDLTVYNQVKKNLYDRRGRPRMQSDKLVISNVRSPLSMDDMQNGLLGVLRGDDGLEIPGLERMDEIILLDAKKKTLSRKKI